MRHPLRLYAHPFQEAYREPGEPPWSAIAGHTVTIADATEKKSLRYAFRTAETGFDPMKVYDRYSVGIIENIFESPLTYDWLARPVKLAPQLVESIPVPEENGTRYTLRFKRGIYFADDPAFKGNAAN
ncbi:MAG: hypothetical protein IPP88_25305 [Betaproteobacteria bacterium]|nr:hypothetical protein [Betaproteobacteria bacterium]